MFSLFFNVVEVILYFVTIIHSHGFHLYIIIGSGSAKAQFLNPSEAQRAATLLGVSVEDLARNTFNPKATGTPTRSNLRAVPSDGGSDGSGSGGATEALEGMISGLYMELVNAVVSLVNR